MVSRYTCMCILTNVVLSTRGLRLGLRLALSLSNVRYCHRLDWGCLNNQWGLLGS